MVNGVRYITTILFIFIYSLKVSALSDKVLIVSSYGTDYKWSNVIIDKINKEVAKKHSGIEINVEFLSSEFIENPCTWGDKMDILLSNYKKNKPLAIILISDEAWMAYQDANATYFNGVPLILCAVKPHTIRTADFVAKHDSLSLSHFTPTLDVMKKYNATGIIREMNVKGYLSLMDNLIKGLDQFVFITDKRFYGIYTKLLLQQECNKNYPLIPVKYFDARFVSTDSLLDQLPHVPPTTGVLLTSWLTGEHGFEYSKDYLYGIMENKLRTPIFITNNIGLEKEYFVGGIFNDGSFWGEKTAQILLKVIQNENPKNIPAQIFHDDECQIAWKVFNHYRLDEDCLPAKTEFLNKPESFFRAYKYYIIGTVIVMTIFLLFYLYTLRSNIKLQNTQKLLLKSIDQTKEANKELEKAHEKLIEALHKAEESDRLKSAFLANMSHEIRTPLNAIVGFSSLISEAESDEDKMEYANLIQRNSDLLLQLISDILDISKIEAGELSLFYENVNVKDLCLNVISSLKTKCKPNVSLSLNDSSEITTINTDKNRLMQVIINFMNNAIKFTNKGHIELGYFSYSNDIIEFYVKDTGIGISQDNLPTIFNRFIKLNSFYEGTGLGLPICKTVIEMMGGIIGVESTVNAGSRFWFRLAKNGGKISDLD